MPASSLHSSMSCSNSSSGGPPQHRPGRRPPCGSSRRRRRRPAGLACRAAGAHHSAMAVSLSCISACSSGLSWTSGRASSRIGRHLLLGRLELLRLGIGATVRPEPDARAAVLEHGIGHVDAVVPHALGVLQRGVLHLGLVDGAATGPVAILVLGRLVGGGALVDRGHPVVIVSPPPPHPARTPPSTSTAASRRMLWSSCGGR